MRNSCREQRWLCAGLLFGTALLATRSVRAQEAASEEGVEAAAPTFNYETAQEKNYLRALLELEAIFGVGMLYYVTTAGFAHDWDLNYRWRTFEPKLTLDKFGPDSNHFGTNFIGHPLGGAGYYVAARSNRLNAFEAYAFAFAGSLLWEYFGEITERVSLNDMIVTPVAGVAIGEATLQLGAFFDRSQGTTAHRILGSVFAPLKALNDWFDGASPKRSVAAYPQNEWHRFELGVGLAVLRRVSEASVQPVHETSGIGFRLAEQLARLPDYDAVGHHRLWFADANVSSIEFEGVVTGGGVLDLRAGLRAVLSGFYFADTAAVATRVLRGGVGMVGVGTTFEYSIHDYRVDGAGPDRVSAVQPLALVLQYRAHLDSLHLDSQVDLGPSFAGLRSHALAAYSGASDVLPEVLAEHAYYFGFGGLSRAKLNLSWRSLALETALRGEVYDVVADAGSEDTAKIRDVRIIAASSISWQIPRSIVRLSVEGRRELRAGTLAATSAKTTENSLRLSLGALF